MCENLVPHKLKALIFSLTVQRQSVEECQHNYLLQIILYVIGTRNRNINFGGSNYTKYPNMHNK